MNNFVKYAIEQYGGSIHPLIVPAKYTGGTGLMNPSVYNDRGKIFTVLRHVNYTFYHSEKKIFLHPWGPLTYLHPEKDMHLRTTNYFCELDPKSLEMKRFTKIDMSAGDSKYEPCWTFVGLEDARLFRWNEKLYICGVRRDVKPNGEGRMELSEIIDDGKTVREVPDTRFRIPAPNDPNSYCEKNWMPVLDAPNYFVKWTNPTEVVSIDPVNRTCRTEHLVSSATFQFPRDIRGGSQVIPIGNGHRMALTHEVDLFKSDVGRKDAVYYHRFITWDSNWNIVATTPVFHFMDAHVEFATGMCPYGESEVLITFGYQDNAAYILRVPLEAIRNFQHWTS